MQNMPDVLAEHQSIMLENFEAIYISTNGTVPFMSQSFIAGSAILCLFMPNDRLLLDSSLIPFIPLHSETFMSLKICTLHTFKVHMSCFCIGIYLLRHHTPNGHI